MALINTELDWLIVGTRPLGTTNPASPLGSLNAPLKQLLDNDVELQTQIDALIISGGASITSVNGKLGPAVVLVPSDVGASADNHVHNHADIQNIVGGDVHLTGVEKVIFDNLNPRVAALEGSTSGFTKLVNPIHIKIDTLPQVNGWYKLNAQSHVPPGTIIYGSLRVSAANSANAAASALALNLESDPNQLRSFPDNEICYSGSSDASNGAYAIVVRQVYTGFLICPRDGVSEGFLYINGSGINTNSLTLKILGYQS